MSGAAIAHRDASVRFEIMSESVFLDELSCTGQESFLLDCRANPVGIAKCEFTEVAGVHCLGIVMKNTCSLAVNISNFGSIVNLFNAGVTVLYISYPLHYSNFCLNWKSTINCK